MATDEEASESAREEKAEGKAGEAAEETDSERRKRIQKEALAKLRQSKGGPTEIDTAKRGAEYFNRAGGGDSSLGAATRETITNVEKAKPTGPGFTASQVKAKEPAAPLTGKAPTQDDWSDRFPDASSFFDAMRLWREKEREKAAPQKEALKAAAAK